MRLASRARLDPMEIVHGFLLAVLIVASTPTIAQAHSATYWFDPLGWDIHDADYRIDDSIPGANGSEFENRVHDGADRWNSLCCVGTFVFDDTGNGSETWTDGPCAWQADATDMWVFYNNMFPATMVGEMFRCEVFDQQQEVTRIKSARLTFDTLVGTGSSWHTADTEPGANEVWVEEIALHELGHGTGTYRGGNPTEGSEGGHWPAPPEGGPECSASGDEADRTMCPFTDPGHTYRVPLEPHDIDTFQDWY
jgi:hypothetical protein